MNKIIRNLVFLSVSLFPVLLYGQGNMVSDESSMLCVGAHWTEEEGKEFLEKRKLDYKDKKSWEKEAKRIRQQILKGAELEKFPKKSALNPLKGEWRFYDGYKVQNIAFESLPGVFVTGSLYMPLESNGKIPGILSPHGHFNKKGEVGRYRPEAQKRFASMARMGAMVWAYDAVGYGEMEAIGWQHNHGQALKQQLWNSIRGVDFLLESGADPKRIAVTGASGGGTQSFLLAAVDDRIAVSVPVVMVSSHFFGGCVCESGMPIHKARNFQTNNVEIAALIAPKPLLLVSIGNDWTKNNPEVEYPHIKYIYNFYGKSDIAENVHLPEDQHGYDENKRMAVYPFLAKHLGLDLSKALLSDGTLNEGMIVLENQEDLYVFSPKQPFPDFGIKTNDGFSW